MSCVPAVLYSAMKTASDTQDKSETTAKYPLAVVFFTKVQDVFIAPSEELEIALASIISCVAAFQFNEKQLVFNLPTLELM